MSEVRKLAELAVNRFRTIEVESVWSDENNTLTSSVIINGQVYVFDYCGFAFAAACRYALVCSKAKEDLIDKMDSELTDLLEASEDFVGCPSLAEFDYINKLGLFDLSLEQAINLHKSMDPELQKTI